MSPDKHVDNVVLIVSVAPASIWSVTVGALDAGAAFDGSGAISPPRTPTINRLDISPIHRRYFIGTSQGKQIVPRKALLCRDLYALGSPSAIPTAESPTNEGIGWLGGGKGSAEF